MPSFSLINRNMRCIEIEGYGAPRILRKPINRNMRCIEIALLSFVVWFRQKINRNMRCIEMLKSEWGV